MNFTKYIIFLFFSISTSSAQNFGSASYKIVLPQYKKSLNSEVNNLMEDAKTIAEKKTYILNFNDTQSHFFDKSSMESDSNKNDMISGIASIMGGGSNYYDSEKGVSINENIQGVLVKNVYPKKWVISTETKLIDNYTCYKAELIESYTSNGKERNKIIVAWFAPSMPYPYGPKGYNGLPGLIIELIDESAKMTYFLTSLEIKEEPIVIKFPTGKIWTREEYMKTISADMPFKKN